MGSGLTFCFSKLITREWKLGILPAFNKVRVNDCDGEHLDVHEKQGSVPVFRVFIGPQTGLPGLWRYGEGLKWLRYLQTTQRISSVWLLVTPTKKRNKLWLT